MRAEGAVCAKPWAGGTGVSLKREGRSLWLGHSEKGISVAKAEGGSRTWWDAASRSQTPFMLQLSPGIPGEPGAWPRDPSPLPQWADALVSLSRLGSEHLHVLM